MAGNAIRIGGFAFWVSLGVFSLAAKDPSPNAAIRLPITEASDRIFVTVSAEKALSHAWVGQIVQDRQGFLWFGTRDGLYRYDGYQIPHYSPEPNGANGVFVQECCRYALFRDRSDKIWIGAAQSVYQYDSETEQFEHMPFAAEKLAGLVRSVTEDRTGTFWLATSRGLTRYNPANRETARFLHVEGDPATLGSNYVRSTLETKDGTFWVATNGSVDIFDRNTGKVTEHFSLRNPLQKLANTGNAKVRLLEDRSGTVWVASARDGLAFVDRQKKNLTFLSLTPGPDIEPGAWDVLQDSYGALWVGTERGLLRLDRDRKQFLRYRSDPTDPDSLPADWVLALFEDRENGIWVGTANAGVARVSGDPPAFRRYRRTRETGGLFRTDYVLFAYEDTHGTIWAGTRGAINQIDLKTGRYTPKPIGENTEVGSITQDRSGQFWIGTFDGSLFRFDPTTQQWMTYRHNANSSGCGNNEVRALLVDRLGTLWAGAGDSVCSFDPVANRFRVYKTGIRSPAEIDALVEDGAGTFWIGSRQAGLYRLDPTTGKFTAFRHSAASGSLSDDGVTSILVDRLGTIWAGTLDGLNRLDAATGKFTVYREQDGLPSNIVNGLVEDGKGDLWITTSYGLSHFNTRSKTFYNYYRSDGVFDDLTGAWKGRSGEMLFGSYSGLTVFTPGTVEEKPFTPPVLLTNFQIFDKPVSVGSDSPLKKSISVTKALTLSHNQNIFSFEFAALSYLDPDRTRYRYRLRGLESGWNEVSSTQHFARYSTIAPGDYVFDVEARTSRGTWTEKGAEVRLTILPPWWSTGWFRLSCALAIGMMFWLAWRQRVLKMHRQLNLQFEERLRERTRIAQELHDTLLQGFLSASMQVHVALDRLPEDSSVKPALSRALDLMRQVIEEGRNAVRGLRLPHSASLDLECAFERIQQELTAGAQALDDVDFRVIVNGELRSLHPALRDEVYRIGREALINAFRHSRAKKIEMELSYSSNNLCMVVRDDGCGIDPNVLRTGRDGHWGLSGMRERADRIGARFHVMSSASAGTEIQLSVPGHIAFQKHADRKLRWFGSAKRTSGLAQQTRGQNGAS